MNGIKYIKKLWNNKKNLLEEEWIIFSRCEYMYIVKMFMKFFLIFLRLMVLGILV